MEHLSFLVSFVFPDDGKLLCSKVRVNGKPDSGCYWTNQVLPEEGTLKYTSSDSLDLVECLLSLAIIQVVNHRALQGLGIPHLSVTSIVGVSKERIEYEKSVSNCSNISSDQKQELNKN